MVRLSTRFSAVTVAVCAVFVSCLSSTGLADETRTWSFEEPLPESWTATLGTWAAGDGVLKQTGEGGVGSARMRLLTDVELVEGTIEVEATVVGSASFGIIGKYVDEKTHVGVRHGAYGNFGVGGPLSKSGPFGDFNIRCGRPAKGDKFKISLIMKRGTISYVINGIVRAIVHDPLAGKAGRVGLYTESEVEFRDFKVTKTK